MSEQNDVVSAGETEVTKDVEPMSEGAAASFDEDLKGLNVSHRKWVVGGAYIACVVMFWDFIILVFDFAERETFSPFALVPVSLMGILPTAILICVLRSLYQPKNKDNVENVIPVKIIADVAKNIVE